MKAFVGLGSNLGERETLIRLALDDLARLSGTPGRLRGPARGLDADGEDIRANGWGQGAPAGDA